MITVAYSLVAHHVTDLSPQSCAHCLDSLRTGLIRVPGVVGVDVNPAQGKVSLLTDGPADEDLIRAAIDAAGCAVVDL
jgi:copper chaperone CopZ